MFVDFDASKIDTRAARIFVRRAGNGPGLLLLHGFPETHVMWRDVAPSLARSGGPRRQVQNRHLEELGNWLA